MGLEKLLQAPEFIDEGIHRQYEKLGSILDEKSPKARAYTASGLWLTANVFFFSIPHPEAEIVLSSDMFLNTFACVYGLENQKETSEANTRDIPIIDTFVQLHKVIRSPLFLGGITLVGKGVYDIANGYINNEPLPEDTYSNMSVGIGMVGLSSSMFLKDKNPGLLKKDPFWKRAYNWANEKIDSITSKQLPQTVPIPTYSRLRCNTQNQAA